MWPMKSVLESELNWEELKKKSHSAFVLMCGFQYTSGNWATVATFNKDRAL